MGWQKVMKPKEEGGLGLQSAKGRNTTLLAKPNWRLHVEKEDLWAQVLGKSTTVKGGSALSMQTGCLVRRLGKSLKKGGVLLIGAACGRLEGIVILVFGGIIRQVKGLFAVCYKVH